MSGNTGDTHNMHGTTDQDETGGVDTASGVSPDQPDTTDDQGRPVDNPSGG